jgi:DNA mismatch endonuclease (patch repair protein)
MDTLTKQQRSRCMGRIKSKNTLPEVVVRKILTQLGIKYRLHVKKLPGTPDIVISRIKTIFFINGCFWHQHEGCKRQSIPKTNLNYWVPKLEKNISRQKESIETLEKAGWKVVIIWECEIKNYSIIYSKIRSLIL